MNPYFFELQVADRRAQLQRRGGQRDAPVAAGPVPDATNLRVVATAPAAAAIAVPGLAARPTPCEGWAA